MRANKISYKGLIEMGIPRPVLHSIIYHLLVKRHKAINVIDISREPVILFQYYKNFCLRRRLGGTMIKYNIIPERNLRMRKAKREE